MEVTFRAGHDRGPRREGVEASSTKSVTDTVLGRKIEILEIGSNGLWSLSGVFHRVSEQFRTRLRSGEREKSIEHESDPSRLSFAQDQPTKSEFDHRNSSLKYGIEQNYILSQKAVEGHSYGSRDKDSKERSTKHPKETSNL